MRALHYLLKNMFNLISRSSCRRLGDILGLIPIPPAQQRSLVMAHTSRPHKAFPARSSRRQNSIPVYLYLDDSQLPPDFFKGL